MNKLQERLFAINTRKAELRTAIEANTAEDMDATETELRTLNTELEGIEKRMKLIDTITTTTIDKPEDNKMENRTFTLDDKEYRSAFLKTLMRQNLTEIEKRAYDTSNASGVIPTQTANVIFESMTKIAPMLKEITLMNVAGNLKIATQGTRNAAAKHTENDPVNPAADTLVTVELGGYEYIKIISISESVSTMSVDSFEGWLAEMLAGDLAVALEDAIVNGDGTGDPRGVKYATTWNASNSIDYGSGLIYDNMTSAIALLPAQYDAGAKWLMNKASFWNQVAKITDSEGNPIVVKDVISGMGTLVLGYPILISDKVGSGEIYLGNFKKVIGNLSKNITIESSRESGFRSASVDYRGLAIFDCDIANPDAFVKLYT